MLTLKTNAMELRGVTTETSKNGNTYYLVYVEDTENFEPHKFCVRDINILPEGLKKGDKVCVTVAYNPRFKDFNVKKVERVQ